jgi:hypothetical protein
MTKQLYRSATGKTVDMGALRLQNERVRAVGNMKTNARGDQIDEQGRVINTKPEQVNKQYKKQTRPMIDSSDTGL